MNENVKKSICNASINFHEVLKFKFEEEPFFTGRIVYTIDCKDGGIGSYEAFIQRKINK